jgi:hypothetical protein
MSDTAFDPAVLRVVHPLDDAPETKLFRKDMDRIRMTGAVRVALLALRVYLACMILLLGWRVMTGL